MKSDSLGQLILTGVPGPRLDAAAEKLFRRIQPGGFILFARNIESAPQLRKLIDDLRSLSEVEPIITIDQEGGRVSRLRLIGNEPPNAQQLRDKDDVHLIQRHGDITEKPEQSSGDIAMSLDKMDIVLVAQLLRVRWLVSD